MDRRIFGIETEFGCLVLDPTVGSAEQIVSQVKDHAFYKRRFGAIDLHTRDYAFEPARAGGFLLNGGRLYIDSVGSHEEYATPECSDLTDIVAYDKAGRVLLQTVLNDLGLDQAVSFCANSVDHFGGHTFGCHENYLVSIADNFFLDSLNYLLPFLVTRQIYAGVGRVGGHRLNHESLRNNVMELGDHEVDYVWVSHFYGVEIDDAVEYQLSQRADHIVKTISSRVRFNRAIINPKWDSYYDYNSLHRLHILYGEANMSEYATALKMGTTALVLDLIEDGVAPEGAELRDPLEDLRHVSRDPEWKWRVCRKRGGTIGAVDLQRLYLAAAERHLAGRDTQTDWILREWREVLDTLERDPMLLSDRLDWVAKRQILEQFMEAEGLGWDADVLHSLDLEYHNVNPERGLYHGLVEAGAMRRLTTDKAIEEAVTRPPQNTRAFGRAEVIRHLVDQRVRRYAIDWDLVYLDDRKHLDLKDPLHSYRDEAARFLKGL